MPFNICLHNWVKDWDDTGSVWWTCRNCGENRYPRSPRDLPAAGDNFTEADYDLLKELEVFSSFTLEDLEKMVPEKGLLLLACLNRFEAAGFLRYDNAADVWRTLL